MQLSALGQQAFMNLMNESFTWAEGARKRGLIRAYGLATWDCFRKAPGTPGYVSLLSLVQLAQKVGGLDHGLRYSPCWTGPYWQLLPLYFAAMQSTPRPACMALVAALVLQGHCAWSPVADYLRLV